MNTVLPAYKTYFDFDKRLLFLLFCLMNWLVVYLNNEFLMLDEVYYNTYGERVAYDRIEKYLETKDKFEWIGYIFVPITLLVKLSLITLSINIGTLFANIKISFSKIFKIVLVAESLFIITNLFRICWLAFVKDVTVMEDIQYFHPLSLINFFDPGSIEKWLIYPLATLNLFEVAYFFILATGLNWATEINYKKAFSIIVSSYGVGLIIWIIFIMFLSINLS